MKIHPRLGTIKEESNKQGSQVFSENLLKGNVCRVSGDHMCDCFSRRYLRFLSRLMIIADILLFDSLLFYFGLNHKWSEIEMQWAFEMFKILVDLNGGLYDTDRYTQCCFADRSKVIATRKYLWKHKNWYLLIFSTVWRNVSRRNSMFMQLPKYRQLPSRFISIVLMLASPVSTIVSSFILLSRYESQRVRFV